MTLGALALVVGGVGLVACFVIWLASADDRRRAREFEKKKADARKRFKAEEFSIDSMRELERVEANRKRLGTRIDERGDLR